MANLLLATTSCAMGAAETAASALRHTLLMLAWHAILQLLISSALRRWKARSVCWGPMSSAYLFQIRLWRSIAEKALSVRLGEGSIEGQEALLALQQLCALFAKAHREARGIQEVGATEMDAAWCCTWMWFKKALASDRHEWEPSPMCSALQEAAERVLDLWPPAKGARLWRRQRLMFFRGRLAGSDAPFRVRLVLPGLRDRMLRAFF